MTFSNDIKWDLYFKSHNDNTIKVATTKCIGRNQSGVMCYERPDACFKRAITMIDMTKFRYDGAKPYTTQPILH